MNNLLDIHHTIIQVNSICYRKKNFNYPTLWFFLDQDRIKDEIALLKNIPAKICIGIIIRTKNKKNLYKKAKKVAKICWEFSSPKLISSSWPSKLYSSLKGSILIIRPGFFLIKNLTKFL